MKFFYPLFLFFCFLIFPISLHAATQDNFYTISDPSVDEGAASTTTPMIFTITLDTFMNKDSTCQYFTTLGTAQADDFVTQSGSLTILTGLTTTTVSITINGDDTPEADETFTLTVYACVTDANYELLPSNNGVGTILNDDTGDWPPIMDVIPNQSAINGIPYVLNISDFVTEINGDDVNYSMSGTLPAGLDFNTSTGVLDGIPSDNGTYDLSVFASDDDGDSNTVEFVLVVNYGFCYEYSYQQQGVYFTETNDGNQSPRLTSTSEDNINTDLPVEMSLYIKYTSTLSTTNVNVNILDIDTDIVTYVAESTKVTTIESIIAASVPDSMLDIDAAGTYIKDIPLGVVNVDDYFFVDYSFDPAEEILNTPINAQLSFDTNGIPYTRMLGPDIPLCSSTSGDEYAPVNAIFTVVHNDYYNAATTFYNLPTQVVNREGNFAVLALEPDSDTPKNIKTAAVAIELIDASVYSNIEAACQDTASAITPKVWIVFDDNSSSAPFDQTAIQYAIDNGMVSTFNGQTLGIPSDFYNTARQNVAFRTSYNFALNDEDLIQLEILLPGPKYNVTNFSDAVKAGNCVVDMDDNEESTDTIAQWCSNAGTSIASAMTPAELMDCMECVYGISTKLTCSRDNFTIRPEAFMIKLNDQNQTNPTSKLRLGDTISGVAAPVNTILNMAADYNYSMEISATNHLDNNESFGYSKSYGIATTDTLQYIWEPRAGSVVTGCNDTADKPLTVNFSNGFVDANSSTPQVGEYRLNIVDETWTAVDSDPTKMTHHVGVYFLNSSIQDCVGNSTITRSVNATSLTPLPLNGCNISSTHVNTDANLSYSDYNVTFHPYKFDLDTEGFKITPSVGLTDAVITPTSYVYMADMGFENGQDQNMSYHLNGYIRASGYNDSNLSNFVTECYAQPIDINISKTMDPDPTLIAFEYRFNARNASDVNISTTSGDLNNTSEPISLSDGNFTKALGGIINSNLNLNFFREANSSMNPREVTFIRYDVNCSTPADCTFNADLDSNKTTQGSKDLNSTIPIKYYYGRTHAGRQIYEVDKDWPYSANIYFEVYCFDTNSSGDSSGKTCDKLLLQDALDSNRTDDIRWYINSQHLPLNDGNIGAVTQIGGAVVVTTSDTNTTANPSTTNHIYNEAAFGFGYPYKTTMENNASRWLIENEDNVNATVNQYPVEFHRAGGEWSGEHETDTTTADQDAVKTNRRSMW